jgi:hypothetical protein
MVTACEALVVPIGNSAETAHLAELTPPLTACFRDQISLSEWGDWGNLPRPSSCCAPDPQTPPGAADGMNLATAGNWTTNGVDPATTLPSGASQDTARWDGVTSSNLVISCGSVGLPSTGFGSLGINLVLTPNQSNSVQLVSSIAFSAAVAINAITNDSASAAFTLGDSTANLLNLVMRPAGAVHYWVNNSTNPVSIKPSRKAATRSA